MKKVFLLLVTAAFTTLTASAQKATADSKFFDNWYIGVEGGAAAKLTHTSVFQNLNPTVGLRLGRHFTPVVGFAVEANAYLRDRKFADDYYRSGILYGGRAHSTLIRAIDSHVLATVNLSNWFGGYYGQPRATEFVLLFGPGWNHTYGNKANSDNNDLTAKAGIDINFNLGKERAWQLFVEPAILYNLDRYARTTFRQDYAAMQLLVGLNYKFRNSNGTHNFVTGMLRDQNEIDYMMSAINDLREKNAEMQRQQADDTKTIEQLRADLEKAKNVKPTVIQNVVKQVNNNVLQPTVIFGLGKTTIDAAQMASVAMVAKYMKNHPTSRLLIKGYASPEGNPELNQKISEKRAQAVKNALVKRYGISADRLDIQGMGATGELFDEIDFNRVATFTDLTK